MYLNGFNQQCDKLSPLWYTCMGLMVILETFKGWLRKGNFVDIIDTQISDNKVIGQTL